MTACPRVDFDFADAGRQRERIVEPDSAGLVAGALRVDASEFSCSSCFGSGSPPTLADSRIEDVPFPRSSLMHGASRGEWQTADEQVLWIEAGPSAAIHGGRHRDRRQRGPDIRPGADDGDRRIDDAGWQVLIVRFEHEVRVDFVFADRDQRCQAAACRFGVEMAATFCFIVSASRLDGGRSAWSGKPEARQLASCGDGNETQLRRTSAGSRPAGSSYCTAAAAWDCSRDWPDVRASRARASGAPSALRRCGTSPAAADRAPDRRPRTLYARRQRTARPGPAAA